MPDTLITDLRSPISIIAVDGETFGHHHRFGDLGVAALIDRLADGNGTQIVSGEQLVATASSANPAALVAPTSWSCVHGVERWRGDCGCRMNHATHQHWRAPLRIGLETLSAALSAIISRDWPMEGGDHDTVLANAGMESDTGMPQTANVRRLLELERHRLAMFTSCAWFFDDLARIEPRIVMRHAARALDLVPREEAAMLEEALMAILAEARANDPADGTGATIWTTDIVPGRLAEPRLAAGLLAVREYQREQPIDLEMATHDWTLQGDEVHLTDRRTGTTSRWVGEVITMGVVASRVHLRPAGGGPGLVVEAIDLPEALRARLATIAAAFVFDATLNSVARRALDAGELEPLAARRAALDGALRHIDAVGFDGGADVLLHGALDLFSLAGEHPSLEERAAVWQRLAALPTSAMRTRLADRLELVLPV